MMWSEVIKILLGGLKNLLTGLFFFRQGQKDVELKQLKNKAETIDEVRKLDDRLSNMARSRKRNVLLDDTTED